MLFLILFGVYSADENVKELEEINEAAKGHQGDAERFHRHLFDQEHGIFRFLNEKLGQLNQEA
jgi:primosomal protein N''